MESPLSVLAVVNANTALVLVTPMLDAKGVRRMSDELFLRVGLYQATMSLMRSMLTKGVISKKEYKEVDTMFAEKYDLSSSTIYR